MQKQFKNILFFLLAIMPIVDLITSIITRFFPGVISLGIIVKGLLSVFCVFYVFFLSKSKYKKTAEVSYLILVVFAVLYLLTKYSVTEFTFLFKEIIYLFKYFYVFIMFWGLLNIFTDLKFEKESIKKILLINMLLYLFIFLASIITKTGFTSYTDGNGGINAWFYAANETGASLTVLFPVIYLYFKDKKNYVWMLLMIPMIYILSAMGTKVSLLGLAINVVIISIFYIIKNFKSFKRLSLLIVIITSSVFIGSQSITINNVETQVEEKVLNELKTENEQIIKDKIDKCNKDKTFEKIEEELQIKNNEKECEKINQDIVLEYVENNSYINLIFSSRETFFVNTYLLYEKASFTDKLLGLGFNNRPGIDSINIEKLIEIDVLDIFFHFGIIGFILYFGQLAFILYLAFYKDYMNKDKAEKAISFIQILLIGGISSIAGHVLGAPAVSIYIVYYMLMNILPINSEEPKKNKINILALHLNFGGVESSIASQANALCEDYDVEIISTYKMIDQPAFKINDKVKITYLTDVKPNKEEFKNALKNKKFFTAFKEGLKSIKVLYLKKYTMIDAIKHSDASVIISSRVEISELLSKYKKQNVITITEEHAHHNNNKKYINRLKKACKGIDYLVCVSKELTNFYAKEIPHTKSVYIPNGLDYTPDKLSKLNNKNLISVGRLSPEKGYLDLIDVFNEMHKLDKTYHLDIIGDGKERNAIEQKIKDLKLTKSITLHGFQNKEFINKKLLDSSLYLMCSHEESFGIVLIEAGSFGVPQIAFDSAQGAHEIIDNNKNGYLIKNRDAKEFAKKAHELINDKKKLKEFGASANKKALEFSFDNIKKRWLKFIKDL